MGSGTKDKGPRVFISYSHDSPGHADRVLAFANRMREQGIDAVLDQYEPWPEQGWPGWMTDQIRKADFVLMICTEMYYKGVMRDVEERKKLGVKWEWNLISGYFYEAGALIRRFLPVLFEEGNVRFIPDAFQNMSRFCIETDEGYEELYRRLTNQPKVKKPKLGELQVLKPVGTRERRKDLFEPSLVPSAGSTPSIHWRWASVLVLGEIGGYEEEERMRFIWALAAILQAEPYLIRIIRIAPGSIRLVLQMPEESAERLLSLYMNGDPSIACLNIQKVEIHATESKEKADYPEDTEMKKSRVSSEDVRRMGDLEETIRMVYNRLHEFEKRMVATSDVAERFSLRQRIRDEIRPDLRRYGTEYSKLLADLTNPADLPAEEAESVLSDALAAVETAERNKPDDAPQEMVELLKEIREKLNVPGKAAAAKLKVSLPIIPLICLYELELDTESTVTQVWRKVTSLFRKAFPANPH